MIIYRFESQSGAILEFIFDGVSIDIIYEPEKGPPDYFNELNKEQLEDFRDYLYNIAYKWQYEKN